MGTGNGCILRDWSRTGAHLRGAAARCHSGGRREDKLTALVQELRGKGAEVHVIPMDLSLKKSPRALFRTVRDLGVHVDALVNNAEITYHGPFTDMNTSVVMDMAQLNVTALAALTHQFVQPIIAAGEGRILNVSSVTAFQPAPGLANQMTTLWV
tara:strand:- start:4041 stop:4505 length:465 start_codon:yes stop_codon:yes gene_type:complete